MLNAVFTVIFPQNIIYFDDFINSINNQSLQKFDLILINDGVDSLFFEQKKSSIKCPFKVINVVDDIPYGKIREFGIHEVIKMGYDNVVFADSDDIMSHNRVELSLKALNDYPIVFNDLTLINSLGTTLKENIWRKRLVNKTLNKSFLLDKNVVGLGNSAIRTCKLKGIIIPDRIIATDWFIFSKIINDDEAYFLSECTTLYRQHNFNSVGCHDLITIERLKYILSVKEIHYSELCHYDTIYNILLNGINLLEEKICLKQLNYINTLNINFFWWEETNFIKI